MQKPKKYILDMFPYPSGEGLHVGHPKGYIATDIYSRFYKKKGYEVIHPMGWDAFGLPAEQFAIKNKINPKIAVQKNVANFKAQLQKINLGYDWDREISTTDPEFYKWTQWIFKQMFKKGLTFQSDTPINWCPSCKTGLANEDLDGNRCERCDTVVEKKPLRQWNLAITKYADRLVQDLDQLNWPEWVKTAQKNWIGISEGSEIDFKIKSIDKDQNNKNIFESDFKIFTTRADTLFGCTYTVLAPEHSLVFELLQDKNNLNILKNKSEVLQYVEMVKLKTDIERSSEGKEKTGIKLEGVIAINPINGEELPVFIADYVLSSYGTGAIMAVPAHDERDREFAKNFNLEIRDITVNNTNEERKRITDLVNGKIVKKYKLRDWVFARQRYWGEPFPVVFATKEIEDHIIENGQSKIIRKIVTDYNQVYVVADSELPVVLPDVESYEPTGTGESPLANISEFVNIWGYIDDMGEFISVKHINNAKDAEIESLKINKKISLFKRETNTMPQWAGSSWYWIRFLDNKNNEALIDGQIEKQWPQVDVYVGGDHATRHLIYARFWHKFLYDIGVVSKIEPFARLEFLGFILAEDGRKMSKRWGNIINPDDIVSTYGSDTLRVYEMFMAPFEATAMWNTSNIKGVKRFLERVEKLKEQVLLNVSNVPCKNTSIIHQAIKKVEEDIENFKFNTAISQMMITINEFEDKGVSLDEYIQFIQILSPFAPEICEKIVKDLSLNSDILNTWPIFDNDKLSTNIVTIAIQIGGKIRGTFDTNIDSNEDEVIDKLKQHEAYIKYVTDLNLEPKRIIVVKNKIVNIVL